MNRLACSLAIVLLAALSTGCASRLVPFSQELRTQHDLSDPEVRGLQFYVSSEVKLRRELERDARRVVGGHLRVTTGKILEEVIIEERTPGVAVALDDSTITVSFEEGTSLDFSIVAPSRPSQPLVKHHSRYAEPPDPFPGAARKRSDDTVTLLGHYWLAVDGDGVVTFQGRRFQAVDSTHRAHLLIDAESLEEVVESRTVLRGRRLGESGARPVIAL